MCAGDVHARPRVMRSGGKVTRRIRTTRRGSRRRGALADEREKGIGAKKRRRTDDPQV